MNIYKNVIDLIGKTPLVKLEKIGFGLAAEIYGKLESQNPGGSVKDRAGLYMILDAEKRGLINNETIIIEPTSGNTGIALAMICAYKGYKLILTMPETMSIERRKLLLSYGAEIVLTPAHKGMKGAIEKAYELKETYKKAIILQQFENYANVRAHMETTAKELWYDTDGKIDILVSGIGTGGTITGISKVLKSLKKDLITIGVEPEGSPILSKGKIGAHKIQGIGAGFIPKILDRTLIDEIITVSDIDAYNTTKRLAKEEGLLCGISSGAALFAALKVAQKQENKGKMIIVILPDKGDRYLSMYDIFEEEENI
jgi:cysteine synthase A